MQNIGKNIDNIDDLRDSLEKVYSMVFRHEPPTSAKWEAVRNLLWRAWRFSEAEMERVSVEEWKKTEGYRNGR